MHWKKLELHTKLWFIPEGKISLWRSRHMWEDNVKMDIKEWLGEDQFQALVNTVIKLWVS